MFKNISDLAPILADENKALELFEKYRWPSGPVCPRCHRQDRIGKLNGETTRRGLYKCYACRKPFTATMGTIFEGSHLPISKWLYAIFKMTNSKKGISANQLERELGCSYTAAWFMCHRIRYAMARPPLSGKLGGAGQPVEVDETYIGGKRRNNPHRDYKPNMGGIPFVPACNRFLLIVEIQREFRPYSLFVRGEEAGRL